jgi:hypothetical protein
MAPPLDSEDPYREALYNEDPHREENKLLLELSGQGCTASRVLGRLPTESIQALEG